MTLCRKFRSEFQQKLKKQIFIINVQIFVELVLNLRKNEKKIKKITKVKTKQEIFFSADSLKKKFKDNKIKNKNHFNLNKDLINKKNKYTKKKY